jgi:hypothetical protein
MPADSVAPAESAWRRSRSCVGESHCAEVAMIDSGVSLRNSTSPGTILTFGRTEWQNFVDGLKAGELHVQQ